MRGLFICEPSRIATRTSPSLSLYCTCVELIVLYSLDRGNLALCHQGDIYVPVGTLDPWDLHRLPCSLNCEHFSLLHNWISPLNLLEHAVLSSCHFWNVQGTVNETNLNLIRGTSNVLCTTRAVGLLSQLRDRQFHDLPRTRLVKL